MVDSEGFRAYLQNQLLERCRKNARYSLRSFARTLDIESSTLSKLLSGKRRISEKTMRRLSDRLGTSPTVRQKFFIAPEVNLELDYQQISQESFAVIADWYHYALLELARTRGFDGDPKRAARQLGIPVAMVNAALERLKKLGLIEIDCDGKWQETGANLSTVDQLDTSVAMREHERQILQKALDALAELPSTMRDQTSLTLAFNAQRLGEARDFITRFRRAFDRKFGDDLTRDQVFALSISFFPLTQNLKPKSRVKARTHQESLS